jgi:ornithine decarboxylase
VKCNPEPAVLRALWKGGMRHFDCASAGEVRLVRSMFADCRDPLHAPGEGARRRSARRTWSGTAVRDFVLDSTDELAKILDETGGGAGGLGLVVRLALPKGTAMYDLSGKFGAEPEAAAALLRAARPHAAKLGVSFHVGSQCLEPAAYARAVALAARVIRESGVAGGAAGCRRRLSGGLSGRRPAAARRFTTAIAIAAAEHGLSGLELWAEPGRALVAGGASVIIQVQHRRDGTLFVNDGVYGALSDAGVPGFRFPARLVRPAAPRWPVCLLRSDLRQRGPHEGSVPAAGRREGGRLDRGGSARRLWRGAAHGLQWLRPGRDRRGGGCPAAADPGLRHRGGRLTAAAQAWRKIR